MSATRPDRSQKVFKLKLYTISAVFISHIPVSCKCMQSKNHTLFIINKSKIQNIQTGNVVPRKPSSTLCLAWISMSFFQYLNLTSSCTVIWSASLCLTGYVEYYTIPREVKTDYHNLRVQSTKEAALPARIAFGSFSTRNTCFFYLYTTQ